MKKMFYADKFFFEDEIKGPGYLEVINGAFGNYFPELPADNVEVIDYSGKWIAPGLVDTHIHGLMGCDVMDGDAKSLNTISENLLKCGVTTFLPTTLTASVKTLTHVVKTIGDHYEAVKGAKIRGIFLEGPFFTEKYKGAQNENYFSVPKVEILNQWIKESKGLIKKIALAPELEGVEAFVNYATQHHIKVALAHSNATFAQAELAVKSGASIFVHTYNGMSPIHHREPGMVGASMVLEDVYAEIISDGHHVHPQAIHLLMKARGREQVVLVSDCMSAGLMPEGSYKLGEYPVTVKERAARLTNGGLAGSVLRLIDGVKNVVNWNIATPEQAIKMATLIPAKSMDIDHKCGKIQLGYEADFIVLTPELKLEATYLNGQLKYNQNNH